LLALSECFFNQLGAVKCNPVTTGGSDENAWSNYKLMTELSAISRQQSANAALAES